MANVSINNITETWNSSGTTFTGIKYNVTDTASAAGSKLIDLQVGGVSKFSVVKDGSVNATYFAVGGSGNARLLASGWYGVMQTENTDAFTFGGGANTLGNPSGGGIGLNTNGVLGWGGANPDLYLRRDAADILAQRRGTNAQSYRIYLTYTDASNYSRFAVNTSANYYRVTSEAAGTGAKKPIVTDVYQSASDPTTSDIPDGTSTVWKNTTSGVVKLWVNNGGTLIGVALV